LKKFKGAVNSKWYLMLGNPVNFTGATMRSQRFSYREEQTNIVSVKT